MSLSKMLSPDPISPVLNASDVTEVSGVRIDGRCVVADVLVGWMVTVEGELVETKRKVSSKMSVVLSRGKSGRSRNDDVAMTSGKSEVSGADDDSDGLASTI